MWSGKFIDLGELPPAKGFSKPLSSMVSSMEGKVILMQASDLIQTKKVIPNLSTWVQCFNIYTAVVLTRFPTRATSLLMYQVTIARLSGEFQWASVAVYDSNFRQEAADTGNWDWTKIDGALYAKC